MELENLDASHKLYANGEEKHHGSRQSIRNSQRFSDWMGAKEIDQKEVISTLKRVCLVCFVFFILELIGGVMSDSVAVISDALHLSIDLIGYGIQIMSAYVATRKPNKVYNFGYLRTECIGALFNCLTIWTLTVYLLYEAVLRIFHPSERFEPKIMLWTSTFGVIANLVMAVMIYGTKILVYLVKYPCLSEKEKEQQLETKDSDNLNIRAVMAHIMGDLVYSVGVLIAAIAININPNWQIIDSLCTILFSYVVLHITVPLFKDSARVIMEAQPINIDRQSIELQLTTITGIVELKCLKIWSITQNHNNAVLHLLIVSIYPPIPEKQNDDSDEEKIKIKAQSVFKEAGVTFSTIQCWNENQYYPFKEDCFQHKEFN